MATLEEENILATPLHGIIIPSGLLLVGSLIVGFQADEYTYTAYGFLLTICLVVAKVYRGRSERILNPKKFQEFEIIEKIPVSHNTNIYRFALPKKNDVLGLPTGQHITISAEINGKEVTRSYTPISSDEDKGYFDLLIKHYPDGNISKHVNGLMAHQTIRVKGPKGKMIYVPNMSKKIGMICGGTGIAPMLQVLGTIVRNPEDFTEVSLLYANNAEEDILLKEDIDELAAKYPNFKVHYILSAPSANWEGSTGFITEDLIKEHLPAPSTHTRILICGPPPMVSAMKRATLALGFEKARPVSRLEDQVFVF